MGPSLTTVMGDIVGWDVGLPVGLVVGLDELLSGGVSEVLMGLAVGSFLIVSMGMLMDISTSISSTVGQQVDSDERMVAHSSLVPSTTGAKRAAVPHVLPSELGIGTVSSTVIPPVAPQ